MVSSVASWERFMTHWINAAVFLRAGVWHARLKNLNKILLDVRELTERIDTSIKFLSDMFSARQYRMAAGKIGVDDYRRLVESKLHTAGGSCTLS